MKKTKINKKEVNAFVFSIVLLGFIFSFNKWGVNTFNIETGLKNWFRMILVAGVTLSTHLFAQKTIAKKYGSITEYNLLKIKQYWFTKVTHFKKAFKKGIPLGPILAIIFSFISNGLIKFAAIGSSKIESIKVLRLGKKFKHLTNFEVALIALAGPLANILLAIIFQAALVNYSIPLKPFINMNIAIALYSMIPFSSLNGSKIFFGSKLTYLFSLIFMIFTTSLLILNIVPLISILLSLIILGNPFLMHKRQQLGTTF